MVYATGSIGCGLGAFGPGQEKTFSPRSPGTCPIGWKWDGSKCVNISTGQTHPFCRSGETWSARDSRCVPTYQWTRPGPRTPGGPIRLLSTNIAF